MKIIFMGTPHFAVHSLNAILQTKNEVVGVVTATDKHGGRGKKIIQSPVKKCAAENNLTILQPKNLKDESFIHELKTLNADLFIVVAFRMLPKEVWQLPQFGTFNLHASLLPNYRGAAPINWVIINGETQTGVTTFFIDEKIDTGNILLQEKVNIAKDETAGYLHDKLMTIGAKLVVTTINKIQNKTIVPKKQNENQFQKKAYKIFKETCKIDWSDDVEHIYNKIRGLNPYPASWGILKLPNREIIVKFFEVKIEQCLHNLNFGSILKTEKSLKIAVKGGFLEILELQLQNKKRLKIKELLNGFELVDDSFFI